MDAMDSNRSHIPQQPNWFIAFRIIQLVLTVIVLALSAYGLATSDLIWNALCIAIFTSSVGLPVLIWELVAMTASPRAYNYWAVLAFEIFFVIFWLASFADVAALTAAISDAITYSNLDKRDYYYYSEIYVSYTYFVILAVNSAVAAVNWVMYIVTIVLTSIYIHRHRQAGGHNRPVDLTTFAESAAPPYNAGVLPVEKPVAQGTVMHDSQVSQPEQPQFNQVQQQSYVPSPVQSQAQSDLYPTHVGHRG